MQWLFLFDIEMDVFPDGKMDNSFYSHPFQSSFTTIFLTFNPYFKTILWQN